MPADLAGGQVPRDELGGDGDHVLLVTRQFAAEDGEVVPLQRVLQGAAGRGQAVSVVSCYCMQIRLIYRTYMLFVP